MQIDLNSFVKELYIKAQSKDLEWSTLTQIFLENYKNSLKRIQTLRHNEDLIILINRFMDNHSITMVSQINDELLRVYQKEEIASGHKACTINKKIACIKRIIHMAEDAEMIEPVRFKIKNLKEDITKIETIRADELSHILNYLNLKGNKMHLLAFLLLASTGIRRTELVNIKLSNINVDEEYIYLEYTKTGDPRNIFFEGDKDIKELISYFLKKNKAYLFEYRGHPINPDAINRFFSRIKKDLQIQKSVSPHKFRHTYATMLLQNGANIKQVQILMGHKNISVTSRYLHVNDRELNSINNRFNPLKNFKNKKDISA